MGTKLRWTPKPPNHAPALELEFSISQCAEMLHLLSYIEPAKLNTMDKQLLEGLKNGFTHELESWKHVIDYYQPKKPESLVKPPSEQSKIATPEFPPRIDPLVELPLLQKSVRTTVQYDMGDGVTYNRVIKNRLGPSEEQ